MISILWISIFLSVLAPLIFWFEGLKLGLNMFIYVTLFLGGLTYLLKKFNRVKSEKAKHMSIIIFILALTYFIYYNRFFNRWNLIVIPFLTLFMIQWMISGKFQFNLATIARCFEMIFIPLDQIGDYNVALKNEIKKNKEISEEEKNQHKKSKKRLIAPLLITILVVFIVGVILASADDDFARIFGKIMNAIIEFFKNIKLWRLILRAIVAFIIYIYISSFFYTYCCVYQIKEKENVEKSKKDLLTLKMILAGLNILYFIFVIVQFKAVLFPSGEIEYSKYAREGFFQLIGISLLNLIMIIYSIRNKHNEDGKEVSYIKIMNTIMIIFTFAILMSSVMKMYFCIDEFGYTIHRLVVWAALFEEFLLIIPTALFINNEGINLSKYYFISIFAVYLIMNIVNFEYITASKNIDRYYATGKIDLKYLEVYTGTDAIKPMMRIAEEENKADTNYTKTKSELNKYLRYVNKNTVGDMDFREFTISKFIAKYLTDNYVLDQENEKEENKRSVFKNDNSL